MVVNLTYELQKDDLIKLAKDIKETKEEKERKEGRVGHAQKKE